MIEKAARMELAVSLRRLVAGEMTNDEFDDRYEIWLHSEDAAIAEIARFGWSLYSSDLFPYRLRGRYAVDDATRQAADRAILFLQSGLEYEWPKDICAPIPFWALFGPGFYLVIGLCVIVGAFGRVGIVGVSMVAVGLLLISPSAYWLIMSLRRDTSFGSTDQTVDFRIWPFRRETDLATLDGDGVTSASSEHP
jgi:hypothetical protein